MPSARRFPSAASNGQRLLGTWMLLSVFMVAAALSPAVSGPVRAAEPPSSWVAAADLHLDSSTQADAVVLGDGRVLHVGDLIWINDPRVPFDAEIYDPELDTWAVAATPPAAAFSLTLLRGTFDQCGLNCNKVLAHLGFPNGSRWYLYDPIAGTWSLAAQPAYPRDLAAGDWNMSTPVLLSEPGCGTQCGQVLFVGSPIQRNGDARYTAELYDPKTNSWSLASDPLTTKLHARSVRLADGRVLVLSAERFAVPDRKTPRCKADASSCGVPEVYDPAAVDPETGRRGRWSLAGDPNVPLSGQADSSTVLADGRVLVAGEWGSVIFDPSLPTDQAWTPAPHCGCADAYNPLQSLLLPTGQVLVLGPDYLDHGFLFDPASSTWTTTRAFVHARRGRPSVTLLPDGRVLMAGGIGEGRVENGDVANKAELYTPPPVVSAIDPNRGPTTGGTEVTITGAGFTRRSIVTFGDTPASSVTFQSSTSLRAVSPPHDPGPVHVSVTIRARTTSSPTDADIFTYENHLPAVTGVTPACGPAEGGTPVTITGDRLGGATSVTFGSAEATIVGDLLGSLSVLSPPGTDGTVDVIVETPQGTSGPVTAAKFTYSCGPPVTLPPVTTPPVTVPPVTVPPVTTPPVTTPPVTTPPVTTPPVTTPPVTTPPVTTPPAVDPLEPVITGPTVDPFEPVITGPPALDPIGGPPAINPNPPPPGGPVTGPSNVPPPVNPPPIKIVDPLLSPTSPGDPRGLVPPGGTVLDPTGPVVGANVVASANPGSSPFPAASAVPGASPAANPIAGAVDPSMSSAGVTSAAAPITAPPAPANPPGVPATPPAAPATPPGAPITGGPLSGANPAINPLNPALGLGADDDANPATDFAMTRHSVSDQLGGASVAFGGLVMLAGCVVAYRRSRRLYRAGAAPAAAPQRWRTGGNRSP